MGRLRFFTSLRSVQNDISLSTLSLLAPTVCDPSELLANSVIIIVTPFADGNDIACIDSYSEFPQLGIEV